jgi:serine/threonine protein kinase
MLAQFRLIEKIGRGSTGEVWKAADTGLDREVAIKLLSPSLAKDPERLARFKEDARTVKALNHPNIVLVNSVEESDGTHFVSMELVRGTTLAERIPSGGLTLDEFFELALPLTDAIRAAHQMGVTHRDLKPGDVRVDEDGQVKVLDFGVAEIRTPEIDPELDTDEVPTLTLTHESTTRGTMPYLSPEQVRGKAPDHRSDVFSLGTLLYQMATGRRPFEGESPADIIVAILKDEPPPVTELNPALPQRLGRVIRHCLKKDRGQRFQTVQILHEALVQLEQRLEAGKDG